MMLNIFYEFFLAAFGVITGCFIGCLLWGYVANKLCEWSLEKDLKKKQVEEEDKNA